MKRDWWNKEFRTYVACGDSITAGGWSSCRERCWASQLTLLINDFQKVPVNFNNVGIGANLVSPRSPLYSRSGRPSLSERLDEHIISKQPDLLTLAHGACDAAAGTSIEEYLQDMRANVQRIREKIQPLIVLVGVYHMSDYAGFTPPFSHASREVFTAYNSAIKELAAENDCLFVDLLPAYNGADWLVHGDMVHGNDLGHRVVANKVFQVLASNCSGLSLRTKTLEKEIAPWRDESTLQQ